MRELIYKMIDFISTVHYRILNWNDGCETVLTDKQLHFWVMGLIGMALLLVVYPIFILLAKKCVLAIAWLYVFTLMFVIAFAIEIEQGITGTGVMDFGDAVSGLRGFMWMFAIFAIGRFILFVVHKIISSGKKEKKTQVVRSTVY